jgi:hypothetical protein
MEISMPRTGTPGLSRGLLASLLADSVGLTLVLGHAGVHLPVEQNPSAFPPSIITMFEFCVSRRTGRYPGGWGHRRR